MSSAALTPAGKTIFVSGTASISSDGKTTHIGDAEAQIQTTIDNVRAVLGEMNCQDNNVVQVIAYCKTAEIEQLFCDKYRPSAWPSITAVADICRDDLLFEIEAAAVITC